MDGYAAALTAATLFGIQYVPVKKHEIYDGSVFQWFMCSGILFAGVTLGVLCEGAIPKADLVDLLGGMFWTTQNMLLMPVVKLLGLGLGFAIFSGTNVFSGYLIGRLGLFGNPADPGSIPLLRDIGAGLLVVSFMFMVFIKPTGGETAGPQGRTALAILSHSPSSGMRKIRSWPEMSRSDSGLNSPKKNSSESLMDSEQPFLTTDASPCSHSAEESGEATNTKRAAGIVLVAVAGFLNSLSAMPFNWWSIRNPTAHKGSFIFAQALGIWMVSTTLYLGYASTRKVLSYASPPHTCIRPAFLSGLIWAAGFVCMCFSIDGLGFTAGFTYSSVVPVIVSSLLSVFWFHEIQGTLQLSMFGACFLIQSLGVCLIALGSH
jgi:glucose uptake protein GlcU